MLCKKCNTELNEGSIFCNKCGTNQNENPKKTNIINLIKKIFSSKIVYAGIAIILVIIIFIVINTPSNKFMKAINKNDYTQAISIYDNKIKGNASKENDIKERLTKEIDKITADFSDEKINYNNASDKLETIRSTRVLDVTTAIVKITNLNNSRIAYTKGLEFKKNEKYLSSIFEFNKVIKEDKNYSKAKEEITKISTEFKLNILNEIDASAKNGDYYQTLKLISDALQALPTDPDLLAKQTSYQKLNEEKKAKELKKKIDSLKSTQLLSVQSSKIVVRSIEYKALYPDIIQTVVKNNSNKTIKSYKLSSLAFDKNGYPVKIKTQFSPFGARYESLGLVQDANILPNETFGLDRGLELDDLHSASSILSCVQSVEFYDDTTWHNPYYEYWIEEYKEKPLH